MISREQIVKQGWKLKLKVKVESKKTDYGARVKVEKNLLKR